MDKIVSVVIPIYNAESFVAKSIDSVLNQTYKNWELILINDASTDRSIDVIKKYLSDDKIRLINLKNNSGVSVARNVGVEEAKGKYIAFLDSDDIWEPTKLEKQMKLIKIKKVDFTFTGVSYINEYGKKNGYVLNVPEKISYKKLLKQNVIACSSVVIKKDLLKNNKMPGDYMHEDFATWLSVLKTTKFAYGINEPLLIYRLSSQSKSGNKFKSFQMNWRTYRYLGLNIIQSIYYMANYVVKNLRKYSKIKKGE